MDTYRLAERWTHAQKMATFFLAASDTYTKSFCEFIGVSHGEQVSLVISNTVLGSVRGLPEKLLAL